MFRNLHQIIQNKRMKYKRNVSEAYSVLTTCTQSYPDRMQYNTEHGI